jgi:hypothetical protein
MVANKAARDQMALLCRHRKREFTQRSPGWDLKARNGDSSLKPVLVEKCVHEKQWQGGKIRKQSTNHVLIHQRSLTVRDVTDQTINATRTGLTWFSMGNALTSVLSLDFSFVTESTDRKKDHVCEEKRWDRSVAQGIQSCRSKEKPVSWIQFDRYVPFAGMFFLQPRCQHEPFVLAITMFWSRSTITMVSTRSWEIQRTNNPVHPI